MSDTNNKSSPPASNAPLVKGKENVMAMLSPYNYDPAVNDKTNEDGANSDRDLVVRTLRPALDRYQIYDDTTLHPLVDIVIDLAGPCATAVTLKAIAAQIKRVTCVFTQALFDRYDLPTDSIDSLVDIVMSCADHDSSAAELESLANHHVSNIILLNEYSNTNYNKYMELAWGIGFTFPLKQSIDDYLMAFEELGEFQIQTTAHYIYYNQDIWHNDYMNNDEFSGV